VREPERVAEGGMERVTWTILNQPAWTNAGLIDETRPMLLFSLQKGLLNNLRELDGMASAFKAPPLPPSVSSTAKKGNLTRAGAAIGAYLSERKSTLNGYEPDRAARDGELPPDGPWTLWERTLIAGKWLQSMGLNVSVYWAQKLPVGPQGPSSASLWSEPVLKITDAGRDIYFKAGQDVDFGTMPTTLYGGVLYRANGTEIERVTLSPGVAADHLLKQQWRLALGEDGMASGTLDLTATGAWVNAMGLGEQVSIEELSGDIERLIDFSSLPGLALEAKSIKPFGSGYRITFDARTKLGIASGGDILFKLPGGLPVGFADVPEAQAKFAFKFPFIIDQSAVIATPGGYRPLALPAKIDADDGKSALAGSVVHWPKRGQAEASLRWTVRSAQVDEYLSRNVLQLLSQARNWSETTIPLRK
jgi:hypothetical protein